MIDRRSFVKAAGAAFAASLTPRAGEALERADAVFGSAFKTKDGQFGAAVLTETGTVITRVRLPARGHEVVFSPSGHAVVFARRPGTFAMAFATNGMTRPTVFSSPPDRHFYGHGTFSADGKLLYATENDFDHARGVIGIYDATDGFRRLCEFSTHGTGPHDILLFGRALVVANGGLETHPDYGRTKLNVATMQPSLVFIDSRDGTLMAQYTLADDLSKVSIRHMGQDAQHGLFIAGQHEGDPARLVPLVARWNADSGLTTIPLAADATARLKGYIGSIAVNGSRLAVSSPIGGVMLQFPIDDPKRVRIIEYEKVCGLSATGSGFAATSMAGTMRLPRSAEQETLLRWDNHLSAVSPHSKSSPSSGRQRSGQPRSRQ